MDIIKIPSSLINELKRISNRLQLISDLYSIFLSKQFPNDNDMIRTINELRNGMHEAEVV